MGGRESLCFFIGFSITFLLRKVHKRNILIFKTAYPRLGRICIEETLCILKKIPIPMYLFLVSL